MEIEPKPITAQPSPIRPKIKIVPWFSFEAVFFCYKTNLIEIPQIDKICNFELKKRKKEKWVSELKVT